MYTYYHLMHSLGIKPMTLALLQLHHILLFELQDMQDTRTTRMQQTDNEHKYTHHIHTYGYNKLVNQHLRYTLKTWLVCCMSVCMICICIYVLHVACVIYMFCVSVSVVCNLCMYWKFCCVFCMFSVFEYLHGLIVLLHACVGFVYLQHLSFKHLKMEHKTVMQITPACNTHA